MRRGPGSDPGLFSLSRAALAVIVLVVGVHTIGRAATECPIYEHAGSIVAPVPHPVRGPVERPASVFAAIDADAVAEARRWLELGRPAATLARLGGVPETARSRLYRLGALNALGRWDGYLGLRGSGPDVDAIPGCAPILARWDGTAAAGTGVAAAADAAFERLARAAPALAAYVPLWRLEAAAEAGDVARGRALSAELESSALPEVARRAGREAFARLLARAGEFAEARDAYRALALESRGARRAEHWMTAADLADRAGDPRNADRYRRRVVETLPAHAAPIVLSDGLRGRTGVTPIEIARVLLAAGRFRGAADAATSALESGSARAVEREALEIRARARAAFGDRRAAEGDYAAILSRWPNDGRIVEVLYARARLALSDGDGETARTRFANLVARFPGHERVAGARYLIADSYQDDRADDPTYADLAISMFDTVTRRHSRSFFADRAYMRAAHLTLALGRHRDAADRYRAYTGSQSRREARYWLARALEAGGDLAASRAILADLSSTGGGDYYALLSRARLEGRSWLDRIGDRIGAVQGRSRATEPPDDPAWKRAIALLALGERTYAEAELARGVSNLGRDPDRLRAWGRSLIDWGFPNLAIRVGVRLGERGAGQRLAFPDGHVGAIAAESEAHGVDPFLILALIRQESLFDADVVSPVGAIGLMQIMPATGEEIADDIGWDAFERRDLIDPAVSLHFGARYLEQQAARFDGFWPAVLAAYNGGPHNVERWTAFAERVDDPEMWIDRIPFRETRDYVKRVLANYALYERLSSGDVSGR